MKLNVFGSVTGETGYDSHARQLIEALDIAGADVHVETSLARMWDRNPHLSDRLIKIIKKGPSIRSPTVMIAQPVFWPLKLSDRPEKFYGFLVWEGNVLPQGWTEICNDPRVDKVLVPSKHTWDAAVKSGVEQSKLLLIPHGVNADLFKPSEPKGGFTKLKDPNRCCFVFNKGWANGVNDRSGFDILLKAYQEEFKKEDPVRLLAHINQAYNQPGWNFGLEIQRVGCAIDGPQLVHVSDQMPYDRLPDLYNCADYVVSASKAEAFNLTVLEGMSCGLVPIVPNTGGELDYVKEDFGIIYGNEGEIPATGGVIYEGVKWKLPSKAELRKALRRAFETWRERKQELEQMKKTSRAAAEKMQWTDSARTFLKGI